jgi:hypothetical protein
MQHAAPVGGAGGAGHSQPVTSSNIKGVVRGGVVLEVSAAAATPNKRSADDAALTDSAGAKSQGGVDQEGTARGRPLVLPPSLVKGAIPEPLMGPEPSPPTRVPTRDPAEGAPVAAAAAAAGSGEMPQLLLQHAGETVHVALQSSFATGLSSYAHVQATAAPAPGTAAVAATAAAAAAAAGAVLAVKEEEEKAAAPLTTAEGWRQAPAYGAPVGSAAMQRLPAVTETTEELADGQRQLREQWATYHADLSAEKTAALVLKHPGIGRDAFVRFYGGTDQNPYAVHPYEVIQQQWDLFRAADPTRRVLPAVTVSTVMWADEQVAAIPANARGKLTPIQLRNRLTAYLRGGQEKEAALARLLRDVNE